MNDAIEQFRSAIRSAGLKPPEVIEPGKLHRFPTNGKRSDDAGWCKLFPDCEGGVFGDFRSGLSETWQAQREKRFSPPEREAFRQRCEAERRAREAEITRRHAEGAVKARALWKASASDNPYLVRKGVSAVATLREVPAAQAAEVLGYAPKSGDTRLTGRLLLVPIKVAGGNRRLSTLELIERITATLARNRGYQVRDTDQGCVPSRGRAGRRPATPLRWGARRRPGGVASSAELRGSSNFRVLRRPLARGRGLPHASRLGLQHRLDALGASQPPPQQASGGAGGGG
jgi:hypothetical protein